MRLRIVSLVVLGIFSIPLASSRPMKWSSNFVRSVADPRLLAHTSQTRVDGTLNPELVPDEVAYLLFIGMVPRGDTLQDVARRTSFIKSALATGDSCMRPPCYMRRVTSAEIPLALAILAPSMERLRGLEQRLRAGSISGNDVKAEHQALVQDLRDSFSDVTAGAVGGQLQSFISGPFKRTIKIFEKQKGRK